MRRFGWAGALILWAMVSTAFAQGEQIKGRLIGETCAKKGRIGECYLKWANPMVFWTEEGEYYQIDLRGEDLDQVALDKAFGKEVILEGEVMEGTISVTQLKVLNPTGRKEFFKS